MPDADNQGMAAGSRAGYVIEDLPEGRTLVVTGGWTSEARAALERPDVDGVWLNYARGFCGTDLSFIEPWPVSRLLVLDRSVTDLTPLARLGETLENLSVQVAPDAQAELTDLPHLRSLGAAWEVISDTFHAPDLLSDVVISDYDEADLEPLAVQPSLQAIQLKVAPSLETLGGASKFPTLASLKIAAARELHDIEALTGIADTLRELDLEKCPEVYDLDVLAGLRELRYLGINDCQRIRSIEPLAQLARLEYLHAWESTRIEDADLSPLLRLPQLKEIRMRDRREYRPRLSAVKQELGCA